MRLRRTCVLLIALPLIGACQTKPSNVERHYRSSVEGAKAMMIASTKGDREPLGLSGSTARGVSINYHWNQNSVNAMQRKAGAQGVLGVTKH